MSRAGAAAPPRPHRNEVLLVGRLENEPAERQLASGDAVVTFRLHVTRDAEAGEGGADSFDCTVRGTRLRRAALGWAVGDVVEAAGTLRRRFHRVGAASRPFHVVEVDRARRLSRG